MKKKRYYVALLLTLLTSCGLLPKVEKTTYSFIPPESASGLECVRSCSGFQSSCMRSCKQNQQTCEVTNKLTNVISSLTSSERDVDSCQSQAQQCEDSCGESYRNCFASCGGTVIPHTRCVANCGDKR